MANELFYTRGTFVSILELRRNGVLEQSAIIPVSGPTEAVTFHLGSDCTFVNKSAVEVQIESFRGYIAGNGIIDYEDAGKENFVVIDPEFCGTCRFTSSVIQSFDSRFLNPEGKVSLSGELTLLAAKATSA